MKIMEEEKMTIKLPKDFFFGAAMSGPQTEGAWNVGGRLRSYWDMARSAKATTLRAWS